MNLLEWKDSYSVGVQILDEQHKTLLGLINSLSRIRDEKQLVNLFNALVAYAYDHLRTEEKILFDNDYPDFFAHLKKHVEFMGKVFEFSAKAQLNNPSLIEEASTYLLNWFQEHVLDDDRKYIIHLASKGVR